MLSRSGERPVSTYALVVDDLDDGGQAAALELEHAANLDATPACRSDIDRCHFGRRSNVVGRVSELVSGEVAAKLKSCKMRKWRK